MVQKLKTRFAAGCRTQLSACVQPLLGGLASLCRHGYLLRPLLSRLSCFQDGLEHLQTRCRWMTHDRVLGPVLEVRRQGVDGPVGRSGIPPLAPQAIALLPMMTLRAACEAPWDGDRPCGPIELLPLGEQHTLLVMLEPPPLHDLRTVAQFPCPKASMPLRSAHPIWLCTGLALPLDVRYMPCILLPMQAEELLPHLVGPVARPHFFPRLHFLLQRTPGASALPRPLPSLGGQHRAGGCAEVVVPPPVALLATLPGAISSLADLDRRPR